MRSGQLLLDLNIIAQLLRRVNSFSALKLNIFCDLSSAVSAHLGPDFSGGEGLAEVFAGLRDAAVDGDQSVFGEDLDLRRGDETLGDRREDIFADLIGIRESLQRRERAVFKQAFLIIRDKVVQRDLAVLPFQAEEH